MRTRLAPVVFALAVLPVAGLAAGAYYMSLTSVASVLERQTGVAARSVAEALQASVPRLESVSLLPTYSRIVRGGLAGLAGGFDPGVAGALRDYSAWLVQQAPFELAQLTYLDARGEPVYRYDHLVGGQPQVLDTASVAAPVFEATDSSGVPGPGQPLRLSVQRTGAGLVLRLMRPVGGRARPGPGGDDGRLHGYVAFDVPLAGQLPTGIPPDVDLWIADPAADAVVLAPAAAAAGQPLSAALPEVSHALAAGDSSLSGLSALGRGTQRVASFRGMDHPAWTVIAAIDARPYLARPRRTGRLALTAVGLFVLLSGGLIWMLTHRVQTRTRLLEEANLQLSRANERIAEATENKSQFLRRMSHDLRSPMNAIIGYTRILRRRLADRIDAREARNLAHIETSSTNLLDLINDILDLSRIEAGRIEVRPQPVDLRQLAEECADALASLAKPGVQLRRQLQDVGQVETDPDRLRQVLMNLLGNATKFTAAGSITLSLRRHDDAVELAVADTGIGIPPEDLPHIFDEFRQVERQGGEASEGTGLGLAIARKTVELLGGEIHAASSVGRGTTFTVRLGG